MAQYFLEVIKSTWIVQVMNRYKFHPCHATTDGYGILNSMQEAGDETKYHVDVDTNMALADAMGGLCQLPEVTGILSQLWTAKIIAQGDHGCGKPA